MIVRSRFLLLTVSLLALSGAPAMAQRSGSSSSVSGDYAAMLETRVQSLEEQLARMTGQIEQAQYQARMAQERVVRMEEDMNVRFRMLEQNQANARQAAEEESETATNSNTNTNLRAADSSSSRAADSAATRNAAQTDSGKLGELTGSGGSAAPNLADSPADAYDQAFRLIRDHDYDAAEAAMRAFLKRWPKHELSSNASYWLGETFYVRGDYKAATKSFAETYQKFPKGSKAEDTLLKLGLSLAALDRDKDACTSFEQLEAEFKNMSPTTRRRMEQERDQLACGGASDGASSAGNSSTTRRN